MMLWTLVVNFLSRGGEGSGRGAYCRWPGLGMVNGSDGNGEYCGRFGWWLSFFIRFGIYVGIERSTWRRG